MITYEIHAPSEHLALNSGIKRNKSKFINKVGAVGQASFVMEEVKTVGVINKLLSSLLIFPSMLEGDDRKAVRVVSMPQSSIQ